MVQELKGMSDETDRALVDMMDSSRPRYVPELVLHFLDARLIFIFNVIKSMLFFIKYP